MAAHLESFIDSFQENLPAYAWKLLGILVTIAVAILAVKLSKKLIAASLKRRQEKLCEDSFRHLETAATVVQSVAKYAIWFGAIAAIFGQLGLSATMGSMLTAAGVGGVALGIGAQSFVKDVVAGLFFLFEDQMAVGDYVTVANITGTVKAVTLRTTTVQSPVGDLNTIPNGAITTITNFSRANAVAMVDVEVTYESDVERAMQLMQEEGEAYARESADVLGQPTMLGVVRLGKNGLVLRMNISVQPMAHWQTERALRLRIKHRFDQEGLAAPYNKLLLVEPGAS